MKSPGAVIGHGDTMVYPTCPTIFEGEARFALIIGKGATAVPPAGDGVIFGYCNFIDGSAAGSCPPQHLLQMNHADTSPRWAVPGDADEIKDPHHCDPALGQRTSSNRSTRATCPQDPAAALSG